MPSTRVMLPTLIVILSAFASACAVPGTMRSSEQPRNYQLKLQADQVRAPVHLDAVLLLERSRTAAGFDTSGIAYQLEPHEIRYYRESRWAETPGRMLDPALLSALDGSDLFRAVIQGGTRVQADYRMQVELLQLQQDFTTPQRSEAVLRLRVQLADLAENRIVATRTLSARAPAPTADAAGGVAAANEALEEVAQELLLFIAEAVDGSASG